MMDRLIEDITVRQEIFILTGYVVVKDYNDNIGGQNNGCRLQVKKK